MPNPTVPAAATGLPDEPMDLIDVRDALGTVLCLTDALRMAIHYVPPGDRYPLAALVDVIQGQFKKALEDFDAIREARS